MVAKCKADPWKDSAREAGDGGGWNGCDDDDGDDDVDTDEILVVVEGIALALEHDRRRWEPDLNELAAMK